MASAASGDLYISDSTDGIVVKIDSAKTKTIFASGVGQPEGLAFNQSGDLFVADGVSTIYKITPAGTKTVFASGLNAPTGLAFDSSGDLFETDRGTAAIFKFTPQAVKTLFASGFNAPFGIAFDTAGSLFVANSGAKNIIKVSSSGSQSVFAANGLDTPIGLAFDASGDLWETDENTARVLKFSPQGKMVVFPSAFQQPYGIAFNSGATKLIATDLSSDLVSKFSFKTGMAGTVAAVPTPTFVAIEGVALPVQSSKMPSVKVAVSPITISEGASAIFVISTAVPSAQPITVTFVMKGTATEGTDYTLDAAGQVTIPAQQSSVSVTLHALTDAVKDKGEIATMVLQSATNAILNTQKKASITIQ